MAIFGSPFMPALPAALMGQIPGVISEGWDPRMLASALGAPVPATGEFLPGGNSVGSGGQSRSGFFGGGSGSFMVGGQPVGPPAIEPSDEMAGINEALERNRQIGDSKPKKGFKDFLRTFAGTLGDNLTGNPVYANSLQHERRLEEARLEAELKGRMPQQVGSSIIASDGQGGYRVLYRDPSTPEQYALAQGLQPGTAEYAEAVRQYRLGSWNDDALAARIGLSGYNFDRRGELQEDRQAHSKGLQEDRQSHSDAQLGRRLNAPRRPSQPRQPQSEGAIYADILRRFNAGKPINERETAFARRYEARQASKGRSSRAGASDLIGPVYQRGDRRIQFSKKAGGYVDLATGQRVR